MTFYPSVIETTGRSSRAFDLPTKLLQDRIIYIGGEITQDQTDSVIMQLLWLQADNPEKSIDMYINSPGGIVYEGLGIKDIMHKIEPKVNTIGVGICASMGAYLLAAGTGERKAMKNCRIMLHSVGSGYEGQFPDLKIEYEEIRHLQQKIMRDLSWFTKGLTSDEEMENICSRNCYMDVSAAKNYGLIDTIL